MLLSIPVSEVTTDEDATSCGVVGGSVGVVVAELAPSWICREGCSGGNDDDDDDWGYTTLDTTFCRAVTRASRAIELI